MNYFQIIDQCTVRESETQLKIESLGEAEGYVLKLLEENLIKSLTFDLEYKSPPKGEVYFVFGSSPSRERLIKIPLDSSGGNARIKINLKEKIITGHINNKSLYINIEDNIRSIKYLGLSLSNSSIRLAPPTIKYTAPTRISKTKKVSAPPLLTCLLTKDSENDAKDKLQKLEKDFKDSSWGLIVADINSSDSTYEIIKSHDSSASLFHYFQFDQNTTEEQARGRIKEFAKSFENTFPHVTNHELINKKNYHEIESFCFVVTDRFKIEASILVESLRQFHKQPIYIVCDSSSKKFLEIEGFEDLHFSCVINKNKLEDIKKKFFSKRFASAPTARSKYHKPECILYKMEAMDLALEKHNNTFFLDADIVVLDSLQENFYKDIVLSSHFYSKNKLDQCFKYGIFNAGYIFCADKSFPSHWRDIYLNRSTFFEQEGMNHIVEKYDIQTFSQSHNCGWWSSEEDPNLKIKSFHVHTIEKEFNGIKKLQSSNENKREMLLEYLDKVGNKDLKKYILKSEGKHWGGMTTNFNVLPSSNGKINLQDQQVFWHHRSGWNYAIQALAPLHNDNGILFDGFLEKNFAWQYSDNFTNEKIPYNKPWVGFFHNPPDIPEWFFYENSIQEIVQKPAFKESLENCIGLFALSEYHAEFLRKITGKPTSVLLHPSEIPTSIFSYDAYQNNENKKIVNVGYWLRKLNSIYSLPIKKSENTTKVRLIPYSHKAPREKIDQLTEKEKNIYNIKIDPAYEENTQSLERLSDKEYDILLTENIIFLDLYDSSANNAIIESIARATPILVNPIPAVVEYLGEKYPFYFDSLEEAAVKALDADLVKHTHQYLLNCDTRKKLSQDYFKNSFEESEVYKSL